MLQPKKLDIFIAKQFGLLFVGTFFICQFVLMMQFLWRYIDQLIGKGLSMDVLAQFFWYMGLMLVPQALPLAILLSSLITYGNLGESSELTAIKAAGISLMQSMRSLIVIVCIISLGSFYFQNVIGPNANMSFSRLLLSMKQKSPELEIPEGVFYDGIPGSNIYVQRKDKETGMLYNVMIYRMTDSYEDAAIIIADSGRLQSTAEKKHLLLTLHTGEWFENMRQQDVAGSAGVPYRRETFIEKHVLLDFDGDFNMMDAGALSNNARGKSLAEIYSDMDSIKTHYDSLGLRFYDDMMRAYTVGQGTKDKLVGVRRPSTDSSKVSPATATPPAASHSQMTINDFDSLSPHGKQTVMSKTLNRIRSESNQLEFRSVLTAEGDKLIRQHKIEAINKFTMTLSCLLFFFIGAPLGAIIRKGGLGFPVVISVLVFIVYYIFDNTGYRMARGGMWAIWFGKSISTAVLLPLAVFFTYKANNDSAVFNADLWRSLVMRMLFIREKRHITLKEVIIDDPDYESLTQRLQMMTAAAERYLAEKKPPIVTRDDQEATWLCQELESVVEELANSRDKVIIAELNSYPILRLGKWHPRLRFRRDLKTVVQTNEKIAGRTRELKDEN